jgi:hypothetical protein
MRAYDASAEEALRARKLLKDWAGEGYLSDSQHRLLEQEALNELRTTNIFLRLVLFHFTLIIVGAGAGLFFATFLSRPSDETASITLFVFSALCYAAAEVAVARAHLHRYGIEEALLVASAGFLCLAIGVGLSRGLLAERPAEVELVVSLAGAVFSLWVWYRFGLAYAFPAAMIFAVFVPGYWTNSPAAQHGMILVIYAAGLAALLTVRSGHHFDYLDDAYSLAEASLWSGIYLAINLQISSLDLLSGWWTGTGAASAYPRPFYWTTWALTWCLPPVILARGLRRRDRFIVAAGGIAAILTLVTNKPYLGWPRHTWDPMLLGVFLTATAILLRRWLGRGPQGVRNGFTAERLSGREKQWVDAGTTAISLLSPQIVAPTTQGTPPETGFGGGDSGGGGASSDF